jgi:hypothetical protein
MTVAERLRRVAGPYEDPRKVGRDGRCPWLLTLTDGDFVATERFETRAEAVVALGRAIAAGYERAAA